jgi:hypothetical protein
MDLPTQIELPFFAYGVFKPGQLGYHRISDLVVRADAATVSGKLLIRDGLPIIDLEAASIAAQATGYLLHFRPDSFQEAYSRIAQLEPDKQYRWAEVPVADDPANVLVGRSPKKGSVVAEEEWDGARDPLFTSALKVVEETLRANRKFDWDLKPLFHLQMAYLLLWSAIERYVSLRYHLGERVTEKVNHLASEAAFTEGLIQACSSKRAVFRSHRPDEKAILDPENPKKSLDYYYQIRSNIVHRGKAVGDDHDRLLNSLDELLQIFRKVLDSAFRTAVPRVAG